jgi:hypothetical protein
VVQAAGFSSAYTQLDLKRCKLVEQSPEGEGEGYARWLCAGFAGIPLTYAEGDLRGMLAVGTGGQDHCAMTQTFGPFNTPGTTLEWRLKNGRPIAVILRWKLSEPENPDVTHDWLAVTRWTAHDSCRIAVVQGRLPNANALARQAADELAESFDCNRDKVQVYADPPMPVSEIMISNSPCQTEE